MLLNVARCLMLMIQKGFTAACSWALSLPVPPPLLYEVWCVAVLPKAAKYNQLDIFATFSASLPRCVDWVPTAAWGEVERHGNFSRPPPAVALVCWVVVS